MTVLSLHYHYKMGTLHQQLHFALFALNLSSGFTPDLTLPLSSNLTYCSLFFRCLQKSRRQRQVISIAGPVVPRFGIRTDCEPYVTQCLLHRELPCTRRTAWSLNLTCCVMSPVSKLQSNQHMLFDEMKSNDKLRSALLYELFW